MKEVWTYYNLTSADIEWVETTYRNMTLEERIGQLFCGMCLAPQEQQLTDMLRKYHVGGLMIRPMLKEQVAELQKEIHQQQKVPLLLAANLESGSDGVFTDGFHFHNPMAVAATNDSVNGYRLGKASLHEPSSLGINWSFAPVVDLDINFKNPITNVRTYGSDQETVIDFAKGYMVAASEENVAVTLKHFPGDGVDERDHHLLVSVNDLSEEDWFDSFGEIYAALIEKQVDSIMVGHIALPKVVASLSPKTSMQEQFLPASLSSIIVQKLLREGLKFKGVVTTDSSLMTGFTSEYSREIAIPKAIAAGCDLVLFSRNLAEDYQFMLAGYLNGIFTEERLQEAVQRILALKAKLGLHQNLSAKKPVQLTDETLEAWREESIDKSITLVKDTADLLPMTVKKYPRILVNVIEASREETIVKETIINYLQKAGYQTTLYDRSIFPDFSITTFEKLTNAQLQVMAKDFQPTKKWREEYDLVLLVANIPVKSGQVVNRLQFDYFGLEQPWYTTEIPTILLSCHNPYHLFDLPMIRTVINTYDNHPEVLKAALKKLSGEADFKGVSPTDPFCNHLQLSL